MKTWFKLIAITPVALTPAAVHATQYLTVEAARRAAFPAAASFAPHSLALTAAQAAAIGAKTGIARDAATPHVWEARAGDRRLGWVVVDQVIGKHELITYLVALDGAGTVTRVEILDYRETYGGEIRNPRWLAQFIGKRSGSAVRVDRDIRNISGATLSSRHVTDGVRYVLALYEAALARRG